MLWIIKITSILLFALVPTKGMAQAKTIESILEVEANNSKDCKSCRNNPFKELTKGIKEAEIQHNSEDKMAFIKTFKPLEYAHPDCDNFIDDKTGQYGPYGEMIRKQLLRYKHVFNSEKAIQIMATGKSKPTSTLEYGSGEKNPIAGNSVRDVYACSGYRHMSEEEKIYFFVSALRDLSAGESGCKYWATGDRTDEGKYAIGLLQLDSDVYRENGLPLTSQQEIRTQKATKVSNSCISATKSWPSGFRPNFTRNGGINRVQSLHNPEANLACGIGIFMRALGEGVHPVRGAYFGPLNRNDRKPIPYGRTNEIYRRHPLCQKAKR